jgi:PiT family inorganic phosphate transporter
VDSPLPEREVTCGGALEPVPAVIWSGVMNLIGVLVDGISVAYVLVGILPPDVLTPP